MFFVEPSSIGGAGSSADELSRLRAENKRLRARLTELEELALQDELTGLPNRRSLLASLRAHIQRTERYGTSSAMIFVDVDRFKGINDSLGHPTGDTVLKHLARVLVESARASDIVGRLAGDEFGILLEHVDELAAWRMALRIVEGVAASHLRVGEEALSMSVAVGVGMILPGDDVEAVIRRADEQMYRIKGCSTRAA